MTVSLNYLPWVAGLRAESQNHHHQFHAALVNRSSRLYRTPPHSTNLLKKTEAFVSFKLFLTFTAQRKLRDANKLLQLLSLQREAVTEETAAPSFQAASQGRAHAILPRLLALLGTGLQQHRPFWSSLPRAINQNATRASCAAPKAEQHFPEAQPDGQTDLSAHIASAEAQCLSQSAVWAPAVWVSTWEEWIEKLVW